MHRFNILIQGITFVVVFFTTTLPNIDVILFVHMGVEMKLKRWQIKCDIMPRKANWKASNRSRGDIDVIYHRNSLNITLSLPFSRRFWGSHWSDLAAKEATQLPCVFSLQDILPGRRKQELPTSTCKPRPSTPWILCLKLPSRFWVSVCHEMFWQLWPF